MTTVVIESVETRYCYLKLNLSNGHMSFSANASVSQISYGLISLSKPIHFSEKRVLSGGCLPG